MRSVIFLLFSLSASTPLLAASPTEDVRVLACRSTRTDDLPALRAAYQGPPATWPLPCIDPGVPWQELGPLPPVQHPRRNPGTAAKIALGRALFHDPGLSGSGQIACANCHERDLGWADGRRVSFGHDRRPGRRNAPSIRFAGHFDRLFWDGRATSLESQALIPLFHPDEMAADAERIERRLTASGRYNAEARVVFGRDTLTLADIADALAAFQRSLGHGVGRFEAFVSGHRPGLSDAELRGLHLFRTKGHCMNCHHGPLLSDQKFHNLGLHFIGRENEDLGRAAITGLNEDRGAFRTPTLRGVADTPPYMHRGYFGHLRGVLHFYNAGGARPRPRPGQSEAIPPTSPLLRPLGLSTQDIEDLEAFLKSL